ncbi:MAG TPA: class I SAM-dependent methyltransferase [Longimicrobiales bacterium]|nr:class I SAM-dependent methyltransferase [Longimicrobiales bacterium]
MHAVINTATELLSPVGTVSVATDLEQLLHDPPVRPFIIFDVENEEASGAALLHGGARRIAPSVYELQGFYLDISRTKDGELSGDFSLPQSGGGKTKFLDLPLIVDDGVFWPHANSDVLVYRALEKLNDQPGRVLEIGCGTGAVGIAIAHGAPAATVVCADLNPAACVCARTNAATLGLNNVQVVQSDLFEGVRDAQPFDIIVANLPWVSPVDVALGAIEHRTWSGPVQAVRGVGRDGLDLVRKVLTQAHAFLKPDGEVVVQAAAWQIELLAAEIKESFAIEVLAPGVVLVATTKTSAAQSAP